MSPDPDDVLPEQRGMAALRAEIAERLAVEREASRRGRVRFWITAVTTCVVVLGLYYAISLTH